MKRVIGADPEVMFDKKSGYFYSVKTDHADHLHFSIHKSKDLKRWEFVGFALDDRDENDWAKDWYWAPELYFNENNGFYYLFYSAKVKDGLIRKYFQVDDYDECCKIGVAVSKSPEGPFKNIEAAPINYCPFKEDYLDVNQVYENPFDKKIDPSKRFDAPKGAFIPCIDANLFIDEDKKTYLFFSACCYKNCNYDEKEKIFVESSRIYAVELNNDFWFNAKTPKMPTVSDEYVKVVDGVRKDGYVDILNYEKEPQDYENGHIHDYEKSGGMLNNRRWTEGSTTFYRYINNEKIYFVTYSCNFFMKEDYSVGIATSKNVLGPYKKYAKNPIISTNNGICSTGHGDIVTLDDKLYYLHHAREDVNEDRFLAITEIKKLTPDDIEVGPSEVCELIK